MSERRQARTLHLTIHALSSVPAHDLFFVKWERGAHKGSTSRCCPDGAGCVYFEASFTCPCTIIYDKKGHATHKDLIFRAKAVISPGKTKQFADIKLDLSSFVGIAPVVRQTFAMKASGSRAPILVLSFSIAQGGVLEPENLSEMSPKASIPHPAEIMPRLPPVGVKELRTRQMSVNPRRENRPLFASQAPAAPARPVSVFSIADFAAPIPDAAAPAPAPTLLSTLLGCVWSDEGGRGALHGVDCVLFAALLHMGTFSALKIDHDGFNRLLDHFGERLVTSRLVTSLPERLRFLPLYGLFALVQRPPTLEVLDRDRVARFADAIAPVVADAFAAFADARMAALAPVTRLLFQDGCDADVVSELFVKTLRELQAADRLPPGIAPFVERAFVEWVDAALVNMIYLQPTKCDFMASLAWNSFAGRARFNPVLPLNFVRFTEAVSVVQMAQVIDDDPAAVKDICPHLPLPSVFALLSVREIDDDLRSKPDVGRFARTHGLGLFRDFQVTAVDTKEIFAEGLTEVALGEWARVKVPEDIFRECECLRSSFV
jgi:hypothetical protein